MPQAFLLIHFSSKFLNGNCTLLTRFLNGSSSSSNLSEKHNLSLGEFRILSVRKTSGLPFETLFYDIAFQKSTTNITNPVYAGTQRWREHAGSSGNWQITSGDVLTAMGQPDVARSAYEKALLLANTLEPEFQVRSIPSIEQKLADK
jgi:hypothetical protein